ncbi:MAG: ATP-binding protein [Desulfobacterales bacterium]|nr:ATP-binding protein [Desulfobacterales bacterium]
MKIVVASGKGGTGKTTVSASLVSVWKTPVIAVDLDVEEPNLHLFLKPEITDIKPASLEIPIIDESLCNYCRACTELCQFKAISVFEPVIMTFPEMCHGCGGCFRVCPKGAIQKGTRVLGDVKWGHAGEVGFLMGQLKVGEAMSPPLMREVKKQLDKMPECGSKDIIIDAPPGVSCPAVNAVMNTDIILLVTEPTPFGLYDLKLARDAFVQMGTPMGVIINRAGVGDRKVYEYCRETELPILAEIPFDRAIAETYSRGRIIAESNLEIKQIFLTLSEKIKKLSLCEKEPCNV